MKKLFNLFKKKAKLIKPEYITASSTLALAIFTYTTIYQTHSIINQQKREEFTRLRAYVSISAQDIYPTIEDGTNTIGFSLNLKNYGYTPATGLMWSVNISRDDKDIPPAYNSPVEVELFQTSEVRVNLPPINLYNMIKDNWSMSKDTSDFVIFKFIYKTYTNKCFLNENYLTLNKEADRYYLGLKHQIEKEVSCGANL